MIPARLNFAADGKLDAREPAVAEIELVDTIKTSQGEVGRGADATNTWG